MTPLLNIYFSGCGLFEIGAERGGCQLQQSFEIDGDCCSVARANFKHEIIQGDLRRKLVADEKPAHIKFGSYPCNHYSAIGDIHGARTGDDLYLHFFRHLAIDPPQVYGLENVPGMKKFPVVMEAMTRLPGYYVHVFCPVKSQIWLPQRRDRLIIIGSRKRFDWRLPASSRAVSLFEVLEDKPDVQVPDYVFRRLDGQYRDKPIICDPERGDIAPTCVAHYAKDVSTRLVVDKSYRRGVRPFTVREYARLQGVPDWFKFPVDDFKAYRMIGNGVSVPVGEWFARECVRYFRRWGLR